jgi:folate-binding protein YgfZ
MARKSPLLELQHAAGAIILPYGPAEGDPVPVVGTFGELELEYAALRKHCALLDQPYRAVIEVRGSDALSFLNRMITQELKNFPAHRVRRSFWLNRKGRIDADLRVIHLPNRVLLDVDAHAAARTVEGLSAYVITEDAAISNLSDSTHRVALHGPTAASLLALVCTETAFSGDARTFSDLGVDHAVEATIAGSRVVIFRDDSAGETGFELITSADAAVPVYQSLLAAGHDPADHDHGPGSALRDRPASGSAASRIRLRPMGWHAYNIARIEAGTPIYNLDLGPDSLPAESGVLLDRVSFTKGCYLGQEIVARMHARGHPKQMLVALKFEARIDQETGMPRQPVTGAPLVPPSAGETSSDAVGAITSSTLAPMLSSAPIALAQVKYANATVGTVLATRDGDIDIRGVIQPQLAFYRRQSAQS